jgi:hypothetical protein
VAERGESSRGRPARAGAAPMIVEPYFVALGAVAGRRSNSATMARAEQLTRESRRAQRVGPRPWGHNPAVARADDRLAKLITGFRRHAPLRWADCQAACPPGSERGRQRRQGRVVLS